MLLFLAIPRGDVKPLAKDLIERFGSFANVVSAPAQELKDVKGVGDTVVVALKLAPAAAKRLAKEQVLSSPVISSWEQLIDYCQITLGHLTEEEVHVLYLDKKNRLISDDTHGVGTVDRAPIYPREVIRRALSLQATALILVHNHPSGDPRPSKEDVAMTREIQAAARTLEITLHDILSLRGGAIIHLSRWGCFKDLSINMALSMLIRVQSPRRLSAHGRRGRSRGPLQP